MPKTPSPHTLKAPPASAGELAKPELARAHLGRGSAYLARGIGGLSQNDAGLIPAGHHDIDQAIGDFNAAISLEPGNAAYYQWS